MRRGLKGLEFNLWVELLSGTKGHKKAGSVRAGKAAPGVLSATNSSCPGKDMNGKEGLFNLSQPHDLSLYFPLLAKEMPFQQYKINKRCILNLMDYISIISSLCLQFVWSAVRFTMLSLWIIEVLGE
jgi:hypothetical protein